jgi:hypothetical protein
VADLGQSVLATLLAGISYAKGWCFALNCGRWLIPNPDFATYNLRCSHRRRGRLPLLAKRITHTGAKCCPLPPHTFLPASCATRLPLESGSRRQPANCARSTWVGGPARKLFEIDHRAAKNPNKSNRRYKKARFLLSSLARSRASRSVPLIVFSLKQQPDNLAR